MTPAEFTGISEYQRLQEELEWSRVSAQTAMLLNVHIKKGKKPIRLDFMNPYAREKKNDPEELARKYKQRREQFKKLSEKWGKTL